MISLVLANYWNVVELGKAQKTIADLQSQLSDVKVEYELLHVEPDKMKALHLQTGGFRNSDYHWVFSVPPLNGKRYRVRAYVGKLAGENELVDAQEVEHGTCAVTSYKSLNHQTSFWISFLYPNEDEKVLVLSGDRGVSSNRSSLKRSEFPFMFLEKRTQLFVAAKGQLTKGGPVTPWPLESEVEGGKILLFQTAVRSGVKVAPGSPNAMQIWLESYDVPSYIKAWKDDHGEQ